MPSPDSFAEHDPLTVAALYLSGLDHGQLYSPMEVTRAISRAYATSQDPESLILRYRQHLVGARSAAAAEDRRERRAWALRMVADLSLDQWPVFPGRPASHASAPFSDRTSSGRTFSDRTSSVGTAASEPAAAAVAEVFQPAGDLRGPRAARRRPVLVAIAVLALYLVNATLANEAPGLAAVSVAGPVNIGLALVLMQLAITSGAVLWYRRYAAARLDPLSAHLSSSYENQHPERLR